MSVFVDTGVLYAHHDVDAERHDRAVELMDAVLDGTYGTAYTSDYVLDETVTLTGRRTGSTEAAVTVGRRILGEDPFPDVFELITLEKDALADGWSTFRRFSDHDLSFTDAVSLSQCDSRGIDSIMSLNSAFDRLIDRTHLPP